MSEVEAGQWWTEKGSIGQKHRLCVIGFTTKGSVVVQWFGGRVCP
jgi:hypothetical protein